MDFFDLYDDVYDEAYETSYQFIKKGLTGVLEEDTHTLTQTIKTLLDYQGLDWTGRGEVFLAKNSAAIAASETVLQELLEKSNRL